MGYIGSIYEKMDKLERRIDSLKHMHDTETDALARDEIQEELDKLYVEYNKLMDS
jgi:hypothetical protein